MKKSVLTAALAILFLLTGGYYAQAQGEAGNNTKKAENTSMAEGDRDMPGMYCQIPGLTDSQRETLTTLRMEHQKKMRQMRAGIQEKRAHLNSLRLADKYNKNEVNSTIDEIAAMRAELMKANEAHRQDVRSKLKDEQKAWFDSKPHMGNGFGGPNCDGEGPHRFGQGNCMQQDRGKGMFDRNGQGQQFRRGNRGFNPDNE